MIAPDYSHKIIESDQDIDAALGELGWCQGLSPRTQKLLERLLEKELWRRRAANLNHGKFAC